ncbi:L10-interacting MYB domain-containing protein-like [Prosopis cineraria]|uniref:L10-interacting MYB domain-containing protein-like n=1 Tax=Prosopis cineraria TaxID=364024 RepID=UPI0024105C4A|nr:L10-interacting MYB domain-containing protein-like [Prosopis cineraria]
METQEDISKGSKHVWTVQEDSMLVECLVQLKTDKKFVADTGFSAGYLNRLEEMLEAKALGYGLLANPHIASRLKTFKKSWQVVYNMVNNKNTSGFGWDTEKKCVTTEDHVWAKYVKVKKQAGNFRNKCLPHFKDLTYTWGKDRAIGMTTSIPSSLAEDDEEDYRIEYEINVEQGINTNTNVNASEQQPAQSTEVQSSTK